MLAWPNFAAVKAIAGNENDMAKIIADPKVREAIAAKLAAHNKASPGTSSRIKRVILMAEPPSVDGHEITDKGYINQRATMERRHELVAKLYQNPPPAEVIEI
jgi:feruloyl-CoA synthase